MRKYLILLSVLLLALPVFAYSLSYTADTIRVPAGGMRKTDVMISSGSYDSFLVSPADAKTWVTTDKTIVAVEAQGSSNFTVLISPTRSIPEGLHRLSFDIESRSTKEKKRADIYAYVYKSEGVEVEDIYLAGDLQPSGTVNLKFSLRNIGEVKYQDLAVSVIVYSPEGVIYESSDTLSLEPADARTVEKSFTLRKNAPPGDYSVSIKINQLDNLLNENMQKFVVTKKAVLKDLTKTDINLLRKEKTFLFENDGNDYSEALLLTDKITTFDSNFYKGDPPERIEGDNYIWVLPPVAPGGSARISYSLDYSPLFFAVLVAAALFWLYMTRFRTLRVSKYILQKKHIREGEEFTVGVEVKNYSGRVIAEAEVFDFVPTIFQMKDTEGPRPSRKKTESGTELKWTVSNLKHGEERVLTYKIIPVIELSGTINLPQASVLFLSGGKETENFSNAAAVGIEAHEAHEHDEGIQHKVRRHVRRLMRKGE